MDPDEAIVRAITWLEENRLGMAAFVRDNANRFNDTDPHTRLVIDRLVKAVGEDIPAFKFNTAVAKQMEALNDITASDFRIDNTL